MFNLFCLESAVGVLGSGQLLLGTLAVGAWWSCCSTWFAVCLRAVIWIHAGHCGWLFRQLVKVSDNIRIRTIIEVENLTV